MAHCIIHTPKHLQIFGVTSYGVFQCVMRIVDLFMPFGLRGPLTEVCNFWQDVPPTGGEGETMVTP